MKKFKCYKGHLLTPDNTYIYASGQRVCRTCSQAYNKARYKKRDNPRGRPLGYKASEAEKNKITQSRIGEKNPLWKGDNVGYTALHLWIKRRLPKPLICAECNLPKKKLDLANISQEYKRELTDWEWLCRKCHMTKDGRLEKLHRQKGHFLCYICHRVFPRSLGYLLNGRNVNPSCYFMQFPKSWLYLEVTKRAHFGD